MRHHWPAGISLSACVWLACPVLQPTPSFHPTAVEGALPRLKPIRAGAEEKCRPLLGFLCNPLLFSHHVAS